MNVSADELPPLLPPVDLETAPVLKALNKASRTLAELKGRADGIPNQDILLNTLRLQEAKASSEVENIVTTQEALLQDNLDPEAPEVKEVKRYNAALALGYRRMRSAKDIISNNILIEMYQLLMERGGGFRATPGTTLRNNQTGDVVYEPPQDARVIIDLMTELERFINDDEASALDPLIKMALIHHRFESIHPFPDGNGRIGRILNVLYLTRCELLDIPILYLSRHIIRTKADYYRLLQAVRDGSDGVKAWEEWVLYMLEAVAETAATTLRLIGDIQGLMDATENRMRDKLPGSYSKDLLNNLFEHPYTRTAVVADDLGVSRQTAAKYLDQLAKAGIVRKIRQGREKFYINVNLMNLLAKASGES